MIALFGWTLVALMASVMLARPARRLAAAMGALIEVDGERSRVVVGSTGALAALGITALSLSFFGGGLPVILDAMGGTTGAIIESEEEAEPAGDTLQLYTVELSGSGSRLVSFGTCFDETQLAIADTGNLALWVDTTTGGDGLVEVPINVDLLYSHKDSTDMVGSVRIQATLDPDSVQGAAELRWGAAPGESRASATYAPMLPAAMMIPDRTQLARCDLLPHWQVVEVDSIHSDFSGDWDEVVASMLYWYSEQSIQPHWVKYGLALAAWNLFLQHGPEHEDADTLLATALFASRDQAVDNYGGAFALYNSVDFAGVALGYIFTGADTLLQHVGRGSGRFSEQGGSAWSFPDDGGRGLIHGMEAHTYAYMIDASNITYPGNSWSSGTRANILANLDTLVDYYLDPASPLALETPLPGFLKVSTGTVQGSRVLGYMNAQAMLGVAGVRHHLSGFDASLDAHLLSADSAAVNFCSVMTDDDLVNGPDTTGSGQDGFEWPYGLHMTGALDRDQIAWEQGVWTHDGGLAESGTDENTVHDDGLFASADSGDWVWNTDRGDGAKVVSVTSNDEVELGRSITSQTTGDSIVVYTSVFLGDEWPNPRGTNGVFQVPFIGAALIACSESNVATTEQQTEWNTLARMQLDRNLASWADDPGGSTWRTNSYPSNNDDQTFLGGWIARQGFLAYSSVLSQGAGS